ncbi:hypothetical protein NsoK4_05815 [Nitrosopumilus sp. K4]|uniref:hypothetical protein n=1 Tax=Nitrosopumilus sp. K4 TaxID=2795383 RepID=UPI001BA536A8|nr:hypothetical protein [Nitrosopumilus sp. K4]QUC63978.1 hypothetical protein NsoK4_05815 [Nitrosopumilus sp. K4]
MDKIDSERTLEIIERLKIAKIGEYKKWETIIKKIKKEIPLSQAELEYYSRLTRIYKEPTITSRTRIYHVRLSEHDEHPPCQLCGESSEYYCNINDQYFCTIHVVGHDDNEI